MKSINSVWVCVALVALAGCPPKPSQGPTNPAGPCMPAETACVVSVDGVSLIRTPKFWLLDVGGRGELDVAAVIGAAKQCDASKGCGTAMTKPQSEALAGELAQAKIEKLPTTGGEAAAYRLDQKTMLQIWGEAEVLARVLPQLSPVPLVGCTGCGLCIPAQCVLPPPVPPRIDDLVAR